jgi:hypothetical protein
MLRQFKNLSIPVNDVQESFENDVQGKLVLLRFGSEAVVDLSVRNLVTIESKGK